MSHACIMCGNQSGDCTEVDCCTIATNQGMFAISPLFDTTPMLCCCRHRPFANNQRFPLACKPVTANQRTPLLRSLTRPMPPTSCCHLHLQVHRRHVATPLAPTVARSIASTTPTTSTRHMLASRAGIKVAIAPRPTAALSPQTKECSLEVHSRPPHRCSTAAATVHVQPTAATFLVRSTWLRS
jgi:hypothetical protein